MIYLLFFLLAIVILLAISLLLVARFFLNREKEQTAEWRAREEEWRTREKRLTDELLRYAHVPPLEVKQERVAKIPDPDVTPMLNDIDLAMYLDDIKEEIEQIHPEAYQMTPDEVKSRWPTLWTEAERQWKSAHEPLRIQ